MSLDAQAGFSVQHQQLFVYLAFHLGGLIPGRENVKITDDSMKLPYRGINWISRHPAGWTDGEVLTPFGIVAVYAQGDKAKGESFHTRLDFVFDGRLYMRNFENKRYSSRGLVTKAYEFAAEIWNQ